MFEREQLPGLLLGCRGTSEGDLVVLDPAGVTAPRLLISDGCSGETWTDQGLVRVDEDADNGVRILFYPYPANLDTASIEPVVLAERIQDRGNVSFRRNPDGEELLALNLDGDLLRIALPGGETTVLQTAVDTFDVSSDGHYLAWGDLLTAGEDPDDSPGDLTLRDRWTGVDTVLATAPHLFWNVRFHGSTVQLSGDLNDGGRVIALPSLVEFEIPAGQRLVFQLSNERWLLTADDGWYLRNPVAGTETLLTAEAGGLISASLEYMDMLHDEPGGEPGETRELWRYPFDGGAPELLAARVTNVGRLGDGRIFTTVDVDAEGLGELVLVDPDTLAECRIDEHALPLTPFVDWYTPLNGPERDMIAYQVLEGERSGVWIVRPAAE